MLHDPRPDWQANYKSMSAAQLVAELERIAHHPDDYNDTPARKAFIADQLAHGRGTIILAE